LSVAVAVFAAAIVLFEISRLPQLADIRDRYHSNDKVILDRHSQIIDEVRVEKGQRRLGWTEAKDIPLFFVNAVLRSEDRRFFYHPGLDPLNTTITVRAAELMHNAPFEQNFAQKLKYRVMAVALEMKWSKLEILEAYLNLTKFRGDLQGVSAASHGLFDKAPAALSRAEGAVLAALIRSPNAPVLSVRLRACKLLRLLGTPEDCGVLTERHLTYIDKGYELRPYMRMAPHAARRLSDFPELRGRTLVRSTLDREIQWQALHALQKNVSEGAVVVLENATGNVLAYVGNAGSASKNAYVDEAMVLRRAESTLQPLIVAKALDERVLTTASRLEKAPVGRETVSVREALAGGLSIPSVRVLELLGVENFVRSMVDWGFTGLKRADFYGPSLAIGSADVRLLDVANAYRTLANGGSWSAVRFSPDITSEFGSRRVVSDETAFIVSDILTEARSKFWSAVNSGPAWCVGYSEKFTVAVATGTAEAAAPVWHEIMSGLHKRESSQAPLPPAALKRSGFEWFLAGTEPGVPHGEQVSQSRFSFPQDRTVIPLNSSRVFIQIVAPKGDQNVYLNRRRLGRAKPLVPWEPQAGRHNLELRDSKGSVLDRVTFDVRAAGFATAP
jgi:penicillin-binding protein 1C